MQTKRLYLDGNAIAELHPSLARISRLKYLSLYKNLLQELPEGEQIQDPITDYHSWPCPHNRLSPQNYGQAYACSSSEEDTRNLCSSLRATLSDNTSARARVRHCLVGPELERELPLALIVAAAMTALSYRYLTPRMLGPITNKVKFVVLGMVTGALGCAFSAVAGLSMHESIDD